MTKSELEILFKTHYAAMYRLAMSFLYDVDEARDVVSDVFASLLDGGLAIRSDNARGFLLTCVRNSCINVIRHKHMRERFIKLYSTSAEPLDDGPDDSMMLAELRDYIDNHLPPLMRAITSPLRSLEKKPMGSDTILEYIWLRMSRTTPVRIGIMKKALR